MRQGFQNGLRDLTQLVKSEVQKENPVDTGRSRSAWEARFDQGRLQGVVGNKTRYIRHVAEGRRGRMSAKQRRNAGFHRRGVEKAMKRAPELLTRALKNAGVPI